MPHFRANVNTSALMTIDIHLASLYNAASFMAERFSEFDAAKASEALGTEPSATRDVAHGDGLLENSGAAVWQRDDGHRISESDQAVGGRSILPVRPGRINSDRGAGA